MFGVGAAMIGGGVAHADDGGKNGTSNEASRTSAAKQHPAAAMSIRSGVGQGKRPPRVSQPADNPPYTGQPPNHAVEVGLIRVGIILASITLAFDHNAPLPFETTGLTTTRSEYDGMPVYTLQKVGSTSDQAIIALHGGAYVGQITAINWVNYADIARDTGATVIVPVYPLASKATAATVVPEIADLLTQTISTHGAGNVSVLGESAGGGLALAAVQQLVLTGSAIPARMVLASPWLDATVSDPASQTITDPLLTVSMLRKSGLEWAGDLNPSDPLVSPINGAVTGLPTTYVWSGSDDVLSPQTLRLRSRTEGLTNFTFILRDGEVHGWTAFPFLPSAVADRPAIERQLLGMD